MDDCEPAKRRKAPYVSHEIVWDILARLPVESLLRFRCVCKVWHATISRDASFQRANLRFQKRCLLVSPHTVGQEYYRLDDDDYEYEEEGTLPMPMDKIGFYRWEAQQQGPTAPLLHETDLSSDDPMHGFAHCDGLVLLPTETAVHVLNPATRRTLTLPWSPGTDPRPRDDYTCGPASHQAFGLGHDPCSNTYKVARFFYRSYACAIGGYYYATGMEVFTIGTDRHWRETEMQPPYLVLAKRTATFFKGSLVWTIDERNLRGAAAPGFLLFGLEDEAFGVLPPPPCHPRRLEYKTSGLAELHGELCLACVGADNKSLQMWMCNSVKKPQWDRRYTITVSTFGPQNLCPIAAFDREILFKYCLYGTVFSTTRYDLTTKAFKDNELVDLTCQNPSTGTVGYQNRVLAGFDVIHYIPSLIPI